jgi:hypothetical protein
MIGSVCHEHDQFGRFSHVKRLPGSFDDNSNEHAGLRQQGLEESLDLLSRRA